MAKNIDAVTQHALDVVNGEPGHGQLHRLACERHLKDLERQNTAEFPYVWNAEKAQRVLDFAQTLTIAEGAKPKPVRLIPTQTFDIGATFGWIKTEDGCRRFRRRYKSVGRQNGKTFENGIMGTYIAGFSGYKYGKLFTAATKKRQAKLAWEEIAKFIQIDPDLAELFSVKEYKSLILAKETNCTIEALSRDSGLDDGFRGIFISLDEIHQHRDNKIYKSLYNGTRSLPETLVSMITTRGDNLNSFCWEMDSYCRNILQGTATAEDFFVDIYALDEGDDVFDESNWIKANPFLCSFPEKFETLKTDAQTAKDMGGADLRDFKTKSLNMWVQKEDDLFVNREIWMRGATKETLEAFKGAEVYAGLDLSSGGDLTTISFEIPTNDGGVYLWSHSYMPRGRLQEHIQNDLAPYDEWENMGLITVTGGKADFKNDYGFIISELKKVVEDYDLKLKAIGVDPHNFDGIRPELEAIGVPVVIVTQSARALNDATVDMRLLIKSEKVRFDVKNELLTWSFCNAALVRNSFDEMKIDKRDNRRNARIDPVDAVIDAHYCRMHDTAANEAVDLDGAMNDYLTLMGWT